LNSLAIALSNTIEKSTNDGYYEDYQSQKYFCGSKQSIKNSAFPSYRSVLYPHPSPPSSKASTASLPTLGLGPLDASHEPLDAGNGLSRIESLGTGFGAVQDGVASVDGIVVLKFLHPLLGFLITRVDHPAVGLHEDGGAEIFVAVPPIRRAGGRAAGAEDALVHPVQLCPVLHRLKVGHFSKFLLTFALKVRLDLLVLIVEVGHVWYEILDDVHVGKRVNLGGFCCIRFDSAETCERVRAVDVHGAAAANALAAGPAEGQGGVKLVLDLD